MAENDQEEVLDEKESAKGGEEPVEEKAEEMDTVIKNYPANKYELALVAAQEARRLNENWREPEDKQTCRVTEKALERTKRGNVHFTFVEGDDK